MAFVAGNKSRLAVGSFAASCYLKGVGTSVTLADLNTTVLCDTAVTRAAGLGDATFTLNGLWDDSVSASGLDATLAGYMDSAPDAGTPITFARAGFAAGNRTRSALVNAMSYDRSTSPDGLVEFTFSAGAIGGVWHGQSLHDLTAETADGNGTVVDGGAATTLGGYAFLHVTAFSGLSSAVIKVQHATSSGGTYADLATFTSVTGTTSEAVAVATGTTVRQYLRVNIDVTGTGSVTFTCAFARR